MLPDRVSNPGPLTYESGALPNALHGPAYREGTSYTGRVNPINHIPHLQVQQASLLPNRLLSTADNNIARYTTQGTAVHIRRSNRERNIIIILLNGYFHKFSNVKYIRIDVQSAKGI